MYKVAWLAFTCSLIASAQTKAPTGTLAQILVTVGHYYGGAAPPALTRDDLTVTQRYEPLPVSNLIPLRGDRAALELFVLVDHCSNCEPGPKFEELRRFIVSQPSTTAVGIAHIQDGRLEVVENPTQDHERAVKALATPEASKPASPFNALAELIRVWPQGSPRRAVLMVSNGIDPAAADQVQDASADAAIEVAQRARVTVYAIYHPSADYLTSDFSKIHAGQVKLAHVADETGGEAYFLSSLPLPSLAPFLADIADHLANQYLVEFLAEPGEGTGALLPVTVKSKIPDVELMVPARVWVPEHRSGSSGVKRHESREERP